MAYKQDQEEVRADKGLLIAKIVASIVVTIIIIVGFKIMFNTLCLILVKKLSITMSHLKTEPWKSTYGMLVT